MELAVSSITSSIPGPDVGNKTDFFVGRARPDEKNKR